MNFILIRSRNEIINPDHIIRGSFEKGKTIPEGYDEDEAKVLPERVIPAKLILVLTEQIMDAYSMYDGEVKAACSVSREFLMYGEEAERTWHLLTGEEVK